MKYQPRILFFDLETLPNVGTFWRCLINGGYLSADNILREGYIFSAAWMWLDSDKVFHARSKIVTRFDMSEEFPDMHVLRKLAAEWKKAHAVVAQNGKAFDFRWLKTRMIAAGLGPLPPVIEVDTKLLAKQKFNFNSNRLDYLCQRFKIGAKIKTDYDLWLDVMKGDMDAVRKMIRYNRHDVPLLKELFLVLRPHVTLPINFALFAKHPERACSHCGVEDLIYKGLTYTRVRPMARYRCRECRGYSLKPRRSILASKHIPR